MSDSKDRRFWDKISEKYAADPIKDMESYEHKLEMTRGCFTPESTVLEFGCGTGGTALLHAPFVKHILATDFSGEMLRIAETRKAEAGVENVTFRQARLEDIDPATDGPFDVVMGMSILHLVRDRAETLARARDLLKPGGRLVTSTVCLGDGFWFLIPIIPIARALGLFPVLRVFGAKRLKQDMQDAGFEITYEWRPGPSKALFLVARKPADPSSSPSA